MTRPLSAATAAALRDQVLTYPEVGATAGPLPPGYTWTRASRVIGFGDETWKRTTRDLRRWTLQEGTGLRPRVSDPETVLGAVADGTVRLDIVAFSRPGTALALLAGPVGRAVQGRMTRRYPGVLTRPLPPRSSRVTTRRAPLR